MADRFPSIEELDSGAQPLEEQSTEPMGDDFLAREKALLGDDADQFATSNDAAAFADAGDNDNDLLGGGSGGGSGDAEAGGDQAQSAFESQFPEIGSGQGMATAPTTGPSVTYNSGYATADAASEEEPEAVRAWRERRDADNQRRAEQLARQRDETIREAQQNIDDFYENYNSKKDKLIAQTRKDADEFVASREDTVSGGTSWDRIAKLVDVSGKGAKGGASGSGKERFREMLVSLRKDEKAPGATGY